MSAYYPAGFTHGTSGPPATKTTKPAAPTQQTLTEQLAGLLGQTVDPASSIRQGRLDAKAQIAAQIAGYHTLQAQQLAQAQRQAQQINLAAQAAAKLQAGLGDATAQDYAGAAAQQQALAQGFTGQLRTDAEQAANETAAKIAAAGGSAPANNQSGPLGNLLYGLSGVLPADTLAAQAQGAIAAARAIPGQSLAYGQQQAVGALGAGREEAAKFNADIVQALASQGALGQKYGQQYLTQAEKTRQGNIGNAFKLIGANQAAENAKALAASRADNAKALAAYRNRPTYYDDAFGRRIEVGPDGSQTVISSGKFTDATGAVHQVGLTGKTTLLSPGKPTPLRTGTVSDAKGTRLINLDTGATIAKVGGPSASAAKAAGAQVIGSASVGYAWQYPNGKIVPFPGRWGKPSGGRGGSSFPSLSKSQVQHLRSGIAQAFYGSKDKDGKVLPPLDYQAAIDEATKAGYSRADATKMANTLYLPGVRGRPLTAKGKAANKAAVESLPAFITGG